MSNVVYPRPACPICGGDTKGPPLAYHNAEFGYLRGTHDDIFAGLEILSCAECLLAWASPYADPDSVGRFYQQHYRADPRSPYHEDARRARLAPRNEVQPRGLSQALLAAQFAPSVTRALDCGAGLGTPLHALRRLYPAAELWAAEAEPWAIERLRSEGIQIITGMSDELLLPSGTKSFDVIVLSHLLEHYHGAQLLSVLNNVRNGLSASGVLLVEVPNDFPVVEAVGHAPHFLFFSDRALRLALHRAGFEVLFLGQAGGARAASAQSGSRSPLTWRRRARRLALELAEPLARVPAIRELVAMAGTVRRVVRHSTHPIWMLPEFRYGSTGRVLRAVATASHQSAG